MRIAPNFHESPTTVHKFPKSTLRAYAHDEIVVVTPGTTHFLPLHFSLPYEMFLYDKFYYQKGNQIYVQNKKFSVPVPFFEESLQLIEVGIFLVFRVSQNSFVIRNTERCIFIQFDSFETPKINCNCSRDENCKKGNSNLNAKVECVAIDKFIIFYKGTEAFVINDFYHSFYYEFITSVFFIGYINELIHLNGVCLERNKINYSDDVNFSSISNEEYRSDNYVCVSSRMIDIVKCDICKRELKSTKSNLNTIKDSKINDLNSEDDFDLNAEIQHFLHINQNSSFVKNYTFLNILDRSEREYKIDCKFTLRSGFEIYKLEKVMKSDIKSFEEALLKQRNLKSFIFKNIEFVKSNDLSQFENFLDKKEEILKNSSEISNFDEFLLIANDTKNENVKTRNVKSVNNKTENNKGNLDVFEDETVEFDPFEPRLHHALLKKRELLIIDSFDFVATEDDIENRREKAQNLMKSARQSFLLKREGVKNRNCSSLIINGFESAVETVFAMNCKISEFSHLKLTTALTKKKTETKKLSDESKAGLIWAYALLKNGAEAEIKKTDSIYLMGIKKISNNFNSKNYKLIEDLKYTEDERISSLSALGFSFKNTRNSTIFNILKEHANYFGVLNKEHISEESRIICALSMFLINYKEFSVLKDKLAELIYNGLIFFGSKNKLVKKKFERSIDDRLEEIFYGQFFSLGVDFEEAEFPILKIDDDVVEIYKKAGIFYYIGFYNLMKNGEKFDEFFNCECCFGCTIESNGKTAVFEEMLIMLCEQAECLYYKDNTLKILFDSVLVCASLSLNNSSNIKLLRILRRHLLSYTNLQFLESKTVFLENKTENGSFLNYFGYSYGDYLKYKLCVAVLCGKKLKKCLFSTFCAFFIDFPIHKEEQKYLRLYRHLMEGCGEVNVIPNSLNDLGMAYCDLGVDLKVLIDDAAVRIENGEDVDLGRYGIF